MRVKITGFYSDDDIALVKETRHFDIPTRDNDVDTFIEATGYLRDNVLEPLNDQGTEMEDDEAEEAVGVDYVAAWVVVNAVETKKDAAKLLKDIVTETETYLADLE